jgi:hypothetical protein
VLVDREVEREPRGVPAGVDGRDHAPDAVAQSGYVVQLCGRHWSVSCLVGVSAGVGGSNESIAAISPIHPLKGRSTPVAEVAFPVRQSPARCISRLIAVVALSMTANLGHPEAPHIEEDPKTRPQTFG